MKWKRRESVFIVSTISIKISRVVSQYQEQIEGDGESRVFES